MTVITKTAQELDACTPSGSAKTAHNCTKVIPFYPLRYAVQPHEGGGLAYNHANLEKGFPALKGMRYVLRGLRDDDGFLYIYAPDNREQIICFVYTSPDNGATGSQRRPAQFQRLSLNQKFEPEELAGKSLSFPYIPAYDHDPEQVVIWFADTMQTSDKLKAFKNDTDADALSRAIAQVLPITADYRIVQKGKTSLALFVEGAGDSLDACRAHLERFLLHQGVDISSLTWTLDQTLPVVDFGAKRRRIVRREVSL